MSDGKNSDSSDSMETGQSPDHEATGNSDDAPEFGEKPDIGSAPDFGGGPGNELPHEAHDPEYFTKKVFVIGDLQTKRALWANRVGQLKGGQMIGEAKDENAPSDELIRDLEERVTKLSEKITGFRGQSIDDLEKLKEEAEQTFVEMEEKLGEKVTSE